MTNLRSGKGRVLACMTRSASSFPKCGKDRLAFRVMVPASGEVRLRFEGVPAGTYAIALLHDENGNGKADKALMLPREGFGFSRDAEARMGPPKFRDAAIEVGPRLPRQTIKMRYIF
ncbi:hypothetical protein HME9302_02443 [Alteripontixanthobacter maritimus]|uniref:DUF2141 domain-containing protein n=1 Tax=Alteripontixanthobacter maritimus TaxID=2161824 RepID=A0A369Q935_9SPHN|nr:hypothetical protein HME9302_02443 [Alteripontixanthobacter maritimus]